MFYVMIFGSIVLGIVFAYIREQYDFFDDWTAADYFLFIASVLMFFIIFAAVLILMLIIGG